MQGRSSARSRSSILFLLLLGCVWFSGCAEEPPVPELPQSDFILGGIAVNEPGVDSWLDALAREGMNAVSLTNYAGQNAWHSAELTWSEDPSLAEEIRRSKERGFHVVLILRLALNPVLRENRFLWHGMVLPDGERRDAWFAAYQEFVLHWARIAEQHGVDVLMIGSELNALTSTQPVQELPGLEEYFLNEEKQADRREYQGRGRPEDVPFPLRKDYPQFIDYLDARIEAERVWADRTTSGITGDRAADVAASRVDLAQRWRGLIRATRDVYTGRLGYSANFDQYQDVAFWDELDVIGINAYFPLRYRLVGDDELEAALREGWRGTLASLRSYREASGLEQPVIFTELGYTRRRHSTLRPWASHEQAFVDGESIILNEQPIDLEERALALKTLRETLAEGPPLLDGLLYWKFSTLENHLTSEPFLIVIGGPSDDPGMDELRSFLGETPSDEPAP